MTSHATARRCWLRAIGFLAMASALALSPLAVAADDDFYRGKTINIMVGNSAGGGHDAYARLLARYLPKHLAGAPAVIVQNMPGAASAKAVQYLDAAAPKDGTVMSEFSPDIITQALLEPDKVRIDFSKMQWVGSMTRDFRVCYAWHESGVHDWGTLTKAQKFNVGSGGVGSSSYINGAILMHVFGVHINQVLGYPGSNEIRLAIERRELDGACGSWSSVPTTWIDEKQIYPFVRFSGVELPGAPGVPYIIDLAAKPQDKQVLTLLLAAGEIARPFAMSQSVPVNRIAIVRRAFDQSIADPQLVAEAAKLDLPLAPLSGSAAADLIADIYGSSADVIAAAREAIR
jgi:tripartite-type tricarboxylate transporter receptor subunit TctC